MPHTLNRSGITFAVDDVTPETEPLPQGRFHEAVRKLLGGIESCSDYHSTVIRHPGYQPLLAAVHTAFSQHRPLVLSPDAVWITIAQGVAQHMTVHGERLRSRFVAHQDRLELVFECRDWVPGSPENPWAEAFDGWAGKIREHVGGPLHDALVCDFGTTGPVERAASQVVMMDIFERYFQYTMMCICGIPAVTLEGTPADWQRLADKAAALQCFDLGWWLEHLLPICDQFVRASNGDIDLEHWRGICKLRKAYGGDIINGWVAKLFPYIRADVEGPCSRRNPVFESGNGIQTLYAPSGLSSVPFVWRDAATGRERLMQAVGGLLGVTQDPNTLALRPKAGWAVREARKLDVLLARLAAEHETFPGLRGEAAGVPADMGTFYHATDGAELFGTGGDAAYRIVPASAIEPLDWGEDAETHRSSSGPKGRIWHRFAWLPDGTWLAINLDINLGSVMYRDPELKKLYSDRTSSINPICHGGRDTQNRPGRNPVVALSFAELLENMLDGPSRPFWAESHFADFGDAERFTRRAW